MDNRINPENKTNENKPVETDSAEIVRRHLEDENHEITEDDLRNVRIVTKDDEPVTTGAEAAAKFTADDSEEETADDSEEEVADDIEDGDLDAPVPKDNPVTPWVVIK